MPKHANDRALDTVSLRDYFAAMALPAVAPVFGQHPISIPFSGPDDASEIAAACYAIADAMLDERAESDDDAE